MTAPTRDQTKEFQRFYPLVKQMDRLVERYLPEYYDFAQNEVFKLWRPEDEQLDFPKADVRERLGDSWMFIYSICATIFSTLTLNKSIVFKAHADKRNVEGTLGCLTTFGEYAGGTLVFPRFGVSANVQPCDLLIADTNDELHGNLGPIVGQRFSVVAYLHKSLQGRGDQNP